MISETELLRKIDRVERVTGRARPLLLIGLLAIVVGFVLLSMYLDNERRDAIRARDEARELAFERSKAANATATSLEAVRRALAAGDEREARRLLGIAIVQTEKAAQAPIPDPSIAQGPAAAPTPAVQPQVSSVLRSSEVQRHINAKSPEAITADRRVFIQFAGPITRSEIVDLNRSLHDAGWNVQGASGERIATALGLNEVRYSADADRAAAEALAAILGKSGIPGQSVTARRVKVVRPGTLEIWISR